MRRWLVSGAAGERVGVQVRGTEVSVGALGRWEGEIIRVCEAVGSVEWRGRWVQRNKRRWSTRFTDEVTAVRAVERAMCVLASARGGMLVREVRSLGRVAI